MMLVLREPLALGYPAGDRSDSVVGHGLLWFGCHATEHSGAQEHNESPPLLPTPAPSQSLCKHSGQPSGL